MDEKNHRRTEKRDFFFDPAAFIIVRFIYFHGVKLPLRKRITTTLHTIPIAINDVQMSQLY